jgi:heme a synthase
MARNSTSIQTPIPKWHRNLLTSAAIFTVLLIAMGGILCVTQSIRNCPDWPGCFGRIVPPAETGAILEYTHRLLAGISGLLILSAAIAGLAMKPRLRWITIPPLAAVGLVLVVSYFGALVVLGGLAPGWATVDVGSALLVVALMVATAVLASTHTNNPSLASRLAFHDPFAKLTLMSTAVAYIVLVSGILVAGKNSVTACVGWPIYSPALFQMDSHMVGNLLRLFLSIVGIMMICTVLVKARRRRDERPAIYLLARWVGIVFMVEALIQVLLLVFGFPVSLLVAYTVTAAVFWALLVALMVRSGLQESLN